MSKTIDSQKDAVQPSVVASEPTQVRVMSSEDTMVSDLVAEQPTLAQIAEMKVVHRRVPNLLEFPEEVLARHGKEYHYAWLTKDKNLSVKLRTSGWVLCNRTNSPYIKPHRFGGHGAVEQAGMLLAFMPKALADQMYLAPALASQAKVKYATEERFKNQDKDAPVQFYKPTDSGSEE